MRHFHLWAVLTFTLVLVGCASGPRIDLAQRTGGNAFLYHQFQAYNGRTAQPISFAALVKRARQADFVLFGEMHGDLVCNQIEAQLLHALLQHGRRQALAMEFFEADEQRALDAYLAGRIDEPDFLDAADRPKSYLTTHRPLIELCRAAHTPILAANAPRRLVSAFRKFDGDYATYRAGLEPEERQWLPPALDILSGPYCDRFEEMMSGHGDIPAPPPTTQPSSAPSSQPALQPSEAEAVTPEETSTATTTAPVAKAAEEVVPASIPSMEATAPHDLLDDADALPAIAPAETPPNAVPVSQPAEISPSAASTEATAASEMPPSKAISIPASVPASMPAEASGEPPANMPAMPTNFDWRDFYRAQMLWDEAMADAVAAYRTLHDDRHVLLIVGGFHVTNDGGTTIKLFKRCPNTEVLTVQYEASPDGQFTFDENDRGRADVIIYGVSSPRD